MLSALKRLISNLFKFIFLRKKRSRKRVNGDSKITSTQDAYLGFMINMHNNLNMYNVILNNKDLKSIEEMKNRIEYEIINGESNEVQDIEPL
jgi:hypothetical protein